MKIILFLMTSMVFIFAKETAPEGYGVLFYGQFLIIIVLIGYIALSKFHVLDKWKLGKNMSILNL